MALASLPLGSRPLNSEMRSLQVKAGRQRITVDHTGHIFSESLVAAKMLSARMQKAV